MSTTTNNAFIRAYRDTANANSIANQTDRTDFVDRLVVSQMPAEQVEQVSAKHVEVASTSNVGAVTLEDAAAIETKIRPRIDGADAVMPPHFSLQSEDNETTEAEESPIQVAEEPVAMTPVSEVETKPAESGQQLNHFLTTSKVSAAPLTVRYRPQWEVDRFQWSSVSDRLRSRSGHRMEDVIQGLTAQAKAGNRRVAITSYERNEGRTTFVLNLARQAAESGLEVAVLDLDFDNPAIAKFAGVSFEMGWNRLPASKPIGEAGIVSVEDRFAIFPYVAAISTAPERILRERANEVLGQLTQSFDIVIIDAGPIFAAAHRWFRTDADPVAESALVVRDVRNTEVQHVDDVCCRLIEVGIQNMAIIENFQSLR